jgi:hypothetical protein
MAQMNVFDLQRELQGLYFANQAAVPTAPPAQNVPQQSFEWENYNIGIYHDNNFNKLTTIS